MKNPTHRYSGEKIKVSSENQGRITILFVFLFLQKDNFLPFPSLLNIIGKVSSKLTSSQRSLMFDMSDSTQRVLGIRIVLLLEAVYKSHNQDCFPDNLNLGWCHSIKQAKVRTVSLKKLKF